MRTKPPGTYREADGSEVAFSTAVDAWAGAAYLALQQVAAKYHATTTYKELGETVQHTTGVRTRMLLMNWIGQVLGSVARECTQQGEPLLTALCVTSTGTVGEGYGDAVEESYGARTDDLEAHAAAERLECYRRYAMDLPANGGVPALTKQVAAKKRAAAKQRTQAAKERPKPVCSTCYLQLPASGVCDYCT